MKEDTDAAPVPAAQDPQQLLAWEARHRPRAGIAGLIAAAALLAFNVLQQILERDIPSVSGLESLERATQPNPVGNLPSLQTPVFEYLNSKGGIAIGVAISALIGYIAVGWVTGFLGVATRARLPHIRRFVMYLPIVGGVLLGLGFLLSQLGRQQIVSDFLDGPRTVEAATSLSSVMLDVSRLLLPLGGLVLAVGIVIISLNAMRAGLLTRMLGYLGIASGAFMVLVPLPIVQIFWLAAVGAILLGRWPGGVPIAWRTGNAEPWPAPAPRQPRQRQTAPEPEGVQLDKAPSAPRRKRKKRN